MPVYTHLIGFGLGPKYELVLRVISLSKVLHCSIFWFIWGDQLSELSMVTPRYLVESTVFNFEPLIYSHVRTFLFLGEKTIATVFFWAKCQISFSALVYKLVKYCLHSLLHYR